MEKVYNDALGRRGMTFAQEAAVFSVMARRGRAGTALGRAILERFGPDHVPTMSDLETLFIQLVEPYRIPPPAVQASISGPFGWFGTVDVPGSDRRSVGHRGESGCRDWWRAE